jgi:hypothetical protein
MDGIKNNEEALEELRETLKLIPMRKSGLIVSYE